MQINIKQLPIITTIGVWEWEKKAEQTLFLDTKIHIKSKQLLESDNIEDTLNYFELGEEIRSEMKNTSFNLLESAASHILKLITAKDIVKKASVELHKPLALSNHGAKVSVKLSS